MSGPAPSPPSIPGDWGSVPGPIPRAARPSSRRRLLYAGLGVAVVVVVVVATLFASGAWTPSSGNSATNVGNEPTSAPAMGAADRAASSVPGHPWSAIALFGLATSFVVTIPASTLEAALGASGCAVSWVGGAARNLWVPATPATAPPGAASSWLVAYANSTGAILLVSVQNGTGQGFATLSGGTCAVVSALLEPLADYTDLVNSSVAVSSANANGGSTFLSTHAVTAETWGLVAPLFTRPSWTVAYTTCALIGQNGTGTVFNATVDAQTGATTANSTASESCLSLGLSDLAVSAAHETADPAATLAAAASPSLIRMAPVPAERNSAGPSGQAI